LSGPVADFGGAQQRGIEAALARANDAGGVDVGGEQRRVELVVVDDEGNPDVAGQRALVLVRRQEPSAALLGACAPAVTLVRVAEARQVPLVSACGPLPQPDSPVPVASTWQLGPSPGAHAAAVAAALGPPGSGPVALVVSPGRSPAAWASALAAAGQPLAGTWTRGPGGRAGWEVTAAQVRASGATRVLAVTDPPDGLLLWQAVVQQGWQPRAAYVRDAGLSTSWIRAVGEAGEGVVTDLVGDAGSTPEQAVEEASAVATDVVLVALSRAGSARRSDIAEALAAGPAVLLGTPDAGPPPVLGTWRDGGLEQLPR
jgi:ABC-type branched-subunit amino acid transport system substrate-binding protein